MCLCATSKRKTWGANKVQKGAPWEPEKVPKGSGTADVILLCCASTPFFEAKHGKRSPLFHLNWVERLIYKGARPTWNDVQKRLERAAENPYRLAELRYDNSPCFTKAGLELLETTHKKGGRRMVRFDRRTQIKARTFPLILLLGTPLSYPIPTH